jgi:copper chaperone CopZ
MRFVHGLFLAAMGAALVVAGPARADTKVEVKGVHLCCGQCVKTVAAILKNVKGVKGACDQENKTVTITAVDDAAAQKAVDALAAGGFYGTTDNKDVTFKEDTKAPTGKVKSLTISGIHNCCPQCCKAIKETIKKVDGVVNDGAKPKVTTFKVVGDFDAGELIKALNEAGFHVKASKK